MFTKAPRSYLTSGKPYLVNEIDSADAAQITDDDGDGFDTEGLDFDVYEKVSVSYREEQKPLFREVKRKAAVGERIKIVNPVHATDYGIGDEFVTVKVGETGSARFMDNAGELNIAFLREYVVLEPVNTQAEAEPAVKPKRLTVGDFAKVVNPKGYREHRRGHIVEIFKDTHDGQPFKARGLTDGGENWYCEHEITLATAEEVIAAQAEAQHKLAIGPFAGGGFAVVVDESKSGSLNGFENGQYVTVADKYGYAGLYELKVTLPGGFYGYCDADALRQITEAEYNAAVAPKPKFSVGDKIRITRSQGNWSVGTIAIVTDVLARPNHDSGTVRASADGQSYLADGYAFDVLTAEEIATIEKEAQETAKWAKIGRKVGEIKRGDIVEVIADGGGRNPVGRIGVANVNGSADCIAVSTVEHPSASACWADVKLVTPVEQRFDTQSAA